MRFSEAMRLGATLTPQAYGSYFDGKGTCAIGSALHALGILNPADYEDTYDHCMELLRQFQRTETFMVHLVKIRPLMRQCPACEFRENIFKDVAVHLNNDHRWSREQIADWVSTIEQEHERQQPAEVQKEQVTA